MPFNCKRLAEKYAQEEKLPIPPNNEIWHESNQKSYPDSKTRSAWMFYSDWACVPKQNSSIPPGPDGLISRSACITLLGTNPDGSQQVDISKCEEACDQTPLNIDQTAISPPVSMPDWHDTDNTAPDTAAMFRVLKEDGFLHWVNERGMKCINRIAGFHKPPYPHSYFNTPFVPQENNWFNAAPPAQCQTFCNKVRPDSESCFACINMAIQKDPTLCNFENGFNKSTNEYTYDTAGQDLKEDPELLKECVECQRCLANEGSANVNDDSIWKCVTGDIKEPLSSSEIIMIVMGVILVISTLCYVGIHYYFKYRKPDQEQLDLDMISGDAPLQRSTPLKQSIPLQTSRSKSNSASWASESLVTPFPTTGYEFDSL